MPDSNAPTLLPYGLANDGIYGSIAICQVGISGILSVYKRLQMGNYGYWIVLLSFTKFFFGKGLKKEGSGVDYINEFLQQLNRNNET